jgi:diacylglycerol kinase (ATP)
MNERKIVYLVNPISGTREKSSLRDILEGKTSQRNIPFEILPTVESGDYGFVRDRILEEGITDVVVCGGDGSVNKVVQFLASTDVRFGIIPMGSGNGLAFCANIPRSIPKALDVVFAAQTMKADAFYVNERFACMLCGLGFDATVAHDFAKHPKRGLGTYASLTTKHFFSARSYMFSFEVNNFPFEANAYFISIANSNQFGNNFTIAPQASLSDGLLDIVIVKQIAKPFLLLNVMRQVFAGRTRSPKTSLHAPIIYFQTRELTIGNPHHAPLHIDGEPMETESEFRIRVLPAYFNLIHAAKPVLLQEPVAE